MTDFLSIGSVFMQKTENSFPLMVVGYYPVHPDTEEMFDYLVVLYPQGVLNYNSLLMINHSEIGKVLYEGFKDDDTEKLKKYLNMIEETIKDEELLDTKGDF